MLQVEKIIYREVKVEVPVEVIKEVPKIIEKEVVKIIEVIKEVPIETIRTVEKIVPQVAQHGQSATLAVPQLGSCGSSGRAWRLRAARHSQGRGQATGRPATRLGGSSELPPKFVDFTAFDQPGAAAAAANQLHPPGGWLGFRAR